MRFREFIEKETPTVFVDLDGVLCDWHKHVIDTIGKHIDEIPKDESYDIVRDFPIEWWETLPWKPDGKELWEFLTSRIDDLHILTSPTRDPEEKSVKGKLLWLNNQGISTQIGKQNIHIDSKKHKYVIPNKVSILIDDTPKKIDKWVEVGGVGILHTDTKSSITELKKIINAV